MKKLMIIVGDLNITLESAQAKNTLELLGRSIEALISTYESNAGRLESIRHVEKTEKTPPSSGRR